MGQTTPSSGSPRKLSTDPRKVQLFRRQAIVAKLLIYEEMYAFQPLKFWSYWTDVHQMFTRCSMIIANKPYKIKNAIFQFVSECQDDE